MSPRGMSKAMASALNQVLKGHKASYRLLEVLKHPSVYKAAVTSSPDCLSDVSIPQNKHLVVKDLLMERELRAHQLPEVKASPRIRQAVDVIEKGDHEDWKSSPESIKKRIVLEWMDTDLWHLRPFDKGFSNPKLPQIVARSILEALSLFHELRSVHTDVNPNNIFLSNLDQPIPTVKLGDLDNEGVAKNNPGAQTDETRAPEVWKGHGVWHSSDIWSSDHTLAYVTTIFGARDKIIEDNKTAWCLAKINRLVGPIGIPSSPDYKDDFELAAALEAGGYLHPKTGEPTPYISVGSLREELQKIPRDICSEACIDFIEHLLIIDPKERPSAEKALQHPFVNSITL